MPRHGNRRIDSADVTPNAVNTHVMGSLRVVTGHLGTSSVKFWLNLDDFLRAPWKGALSLRVRIPARQLSLQPVVARAVHGGNDMS